MVWRIAKLLGVAFAVVALPLLAADGGLAATAPARPATGANATGPNVDLALVLAVDVSGSIDWQESYLQRKGLADAFVSPEVVRAIRGGSYGRISVAVVFFSSYDYGVMDVPINWTILSDQASAEAFAKSILAAPPMSGRGTAIADALNLSLEVFDALPYRTGKRVIDVSGDGQNNAGPAIVGVRDEVVARGITINGLPISEDFAPEELERYFKGCVIGGPGAFVLAASGFADFARAIRRKLVLEISGLTPDEQPETNPRVIKTAAPALPARPFPRAGQPAEPPYDGPCDFPMFGGGFRGFGRF